MNYIPLPAPTKLLVYNVTNVRFVYNKIAHEKKKKVFTLV